MGLCWGYHTVSQSFIPSATQPVNHYANQCVNHSAHLSITMTIRLLTIRPDAKIRQHRSAKRLGSKLD